MKTEEPLAHPFVILILVEIALTIYELFAYG